MISHTRNEAANDSFNMSMGGMAKSRPIYKQCKLACTYLALSLTPLCNRYRRDLQAQFGLTKAIVDEIYARDAENVD